MKKITYKDYYQNLLKEAEHKIYVKKGQSPPKGKKLQTGPRGGQFFTGTAAEKEKFSKKSAPKSEPKSPKRKSDTLHNDWEDDASDTSAHDIQYGQMKKEMLDKLTDAYEEDYLDQGYEPDEALDAAEEMANDDLVGIKDDEIDERYKEIMGVGDKKETSAGSAGVGSKVKYKGKNGVITQVDNTGNAVIRVGKKEYGPTSNYKDIEDWGRK